MVVFSKALRRLSRSLSRLNEDTVTYKPTMTGEILEGRGGTTS